VIIEIDAEPLSLLPRQKIHPKRDPCLLRALLKTRSSGGCSSPVPTQEKVSGDRHRHDDDERERGRARIVFS
jgi:hypothetical protein